MVPTVANVASLEIPGSQETARLRHGSEGHTLYDLVLEPGAVLHLGHFPVVLKIEGRELNTKKRVKGWAGWAPVSESEKANFQELVLRPVATIM